jgi:hypothetical protein
MPKGEGRIGQITINIEPSLVPLFENVATTKDMTISSYGRKIVIDHLVELGLVTDGMLRRLVTGG